MTTAWPIDFEAFENAIHSWFSDATGLETVWRQQSAPQPEHPYGSLQVIAGPTPESPAWDERCDTDLTRPRGQEIHEELVVPAQVTVSCQVHVPMPDARNPGYNAVSYVQRALGALAKPTVTDALRAAGVAVVRHGPVQNLNEVIEDAFESRANIDVIFRVSLTEDDYVGYIAKINAESTTLGIDQEFGIL